MNWIIIGGSEGFRKFIGSLRGQEDTVSIYENIEKVPFANGKENIYFLLPAYEKGERWIPELKFDLAWQLLNQFMSQNRFYLENYMAQDYFHSELSHLEIVGRERHSYQEYIEFGGMILQARNSFYFPVTVRPRPDDLAFISDCVGTHNIFRPGTYRLPILYKDPKTGNLSSVMNFTEFDSRFMRPYRHWKKFFVFLIQSLADIETERIEKAFLATFPEVIGLAENSDAESSVRKALDWHEKSGLFRSPDGSAGMFEMIRSNDLGVRANLRTDAELLTGALFAAAGKRLNERRYTEIGCNLVDFLLNRDIQLTSGLFKWFDHTDKIWSSDSSRAGLAMINMYKVTNDARYLESALKLADGFSEWLGDNSLCCGYFSDSQGYKDRELNDNPVFYGEMVAFLLQLDQEKYTRIGLRIIERVSEKFPEVKPFGFSDNFTYCRYLLMLSCAHRQTGHDFSEPINHILAFFADIQDECGGIRECAIRLDANHIEAGIAIGDGSDNIADMLYCNNFVLIALSILRKLPEDRVRTVNMELAQRMYRKLREFILRIQIQSSDPKLDGGWMRAFDMKLNEYYGLNKDMAWGAYCIMSGWITGFIPLVFLYEDVPESFFINLKR